MLALSAWLIYNYGIYDFHHDSETKGTKTVFDLMLWSHSFSYQSSLSLSSTSVVQCTLTKQTCFAHHSSFAHLLVRPQWTRLKWNHWPETRVLVSNKHIYKDFYKNVGQRLDLKNWRRESLHIRHVIVSENCQRKIWWPWSHQLWGSCKSAQQSWCVYIGKNFMKKSIAMRQHAYTKSTYWNDDRGLHSQIQNLSIRCLWSTLIR